QATQRGGAPVQAPKRLPAHLLPVRETRCDVSGLPQLRPRGRWAPKFVLTRPSKKGSAMSYPIKNRFSAAVESFRRQFADQPTQALGSILPSQSVHQALAQFAPAFRQRVYPPLTTLSLSIGQALSPDGSRQDAVARMLSARAAQGLPGCSLISGPYCKARQRLPLALIDRLLAEVAERLERQSPKDWRWRGRSLKLVDGTTVSMPDTASNQQAYQANGAQKPGQSFPQ